MRTPIVDRRVSAPPATASSALRSASAPYFGMSVLDPPAEYPQYNEGKGYYAVFFTDRDGLKLESIDARC